MRLLIMVMNGLVAGSGVYAFLNSETLSGALFIVVAAASIVALGESLRRSYE